MTIDVRASRLLDQARSEPAEVLAKAVAVVDELSDSDSISVAYRALSIAARSAGTLKQSVAYARIAADVAERPSIRFEAEGALAGSVAMSGDVPRAMEILRSAAAEAFGTAAAKLECQRGAIATSAGDYETALQAYDKALPIFRLNEDPDSIAMVLHNQGFLLTHLDRLDEAEKVLTEVRVVEEVAGHLLEMSGVDHDLGLLAAYRGDIPEALRRLTISDELHMEVTGDDVPRRLSRCAILVSAGLYQEALDLAKRIAAGAKDKGRAEDEADALLLAARAALLVGDPAQAKRIAAMARKRFESQGRDIWSTQANLTEIEAEYGTKGASKALLTRARGAAERLEKDELAVSAALARLLSARIEIEVGDLTAAESDLEWVSGIRFGPVELNIQQWHATAMLRRARNDTRGADAAVRAGLDMLDGHQSALWASDLRSGTERHGVELGRIGLELALESGRPRRVFMWMERTRARSLRYRPVVPAEDTVDRELLVRLRKLSAELRAAPDDPDILHRRRELQDELSRAARARRSTVSAGSGWTVKNLITDLEDRALLEIGSINGSVVVVKVADGKFSLHEIGESAGIFDELGHLRFDLRRAARFRQNVEGVRRAVAAFDDHLFRGLDIGAKKVVLVPAGPLMAVPWAVLPTLSDRTVTVAPSSEMWWRAQRRDANGEGVVLAAGPDLEHAEGEIQVLDRLYDSATIVTPGDTAANFGSAIRGARIAHAACHARFELDNPMFSALRLGDGDFNFYELERLRDAPDLMVLSACDSGYTNTGAGDELSGLTSALLSMGSRSVVATVGLVPDSEATSDLMSRFHRGLIWGYQPSQALAQAQHEMLDDPEGFVAAASFLCFGGD